MSRYQLSESEHTHKISYYYSDSADAGCKNLSTKPCGRHRDFIFFFLHASHTEFLVDWAEIIGGPSSSCVVAAGGVRLRLRARFCRSIEEVKTKHNKNNTGEVKKIKGKIKAKTPRCRCQNNIASSHCAGVESPRPAGCSRRWSAISATAGHLVVRLIK